MKAAGKVSKAAIERYGMESLRRAFEEFLSLPTLIIVGYLLLAAGSYALDHSRMAWLEPTRTVLQTLVFNNAKATSDLLSTIASAIITVSSIVISLLIVALQQAAGSLTAEVYDQFLRRWYNQCYFGFFAGLSLFCLVTLATVNNGFNPVFGAALALLLTVVALYLLIVLLYTTINQMRSVEVIDVIKRYILSARENQLRLIVRTRSSARGDGSSRMPVRSAKSGVVAEVDLDLLEAAAREAGSAVEIVLQVSIGSYVSYRDIIAEVTGGMPEKAEKLSDCVRAAVRLQRQRNLSLDPGDGIKQLEMIAWTSISTAKSNPIPGLLVIQSLRDVLARWSEEKPDSASEPTTAVVYTDTVPAQLMDTFESLAVASTESMQHRTFAEVLRTLSVLFNRLPSNQQRRTEDIILRILSGLGDHILTAPLDIELLRLAAVLSDGGRAETAAAVRKARDKLARSVGRINSRSTRLEEQ